MQKKNNIVKGCILIAFSFLLFACAKNTQPLSGGPKDTIPPKIIYSIPKINDTSFKSQKIIIKFDEFFSLKNIDAEFFSSPPLVPKPKFDIKKKKLIITTKDSLRDSTTYSLNFGNAILDFHENNVLKNFEFRFSTYNQLDSLEISGKILDAYTHQAVKNSIIMLYNSNEDSLPLREIPLYVSRTDSSGNFIFHNLRKQKYKIFVLEDLNGNFIFDPDESNIAYLDTLITPSVLNKEFRDTLDSGAVYFQKPTDTIPDTLRQDSILVKNVSYYFPSNLNLYTFSQPSSQQHIKTSIRDFKGRIKVFFIKPLIKNFWKFEINGNELTPSQYDIEEFPSKDSLYLWIEDSSIFNKDTITLNITYYADDKATLKTDTINFAQYQYSSDSTKLAISPVSENINLFENFILISETTIKTIDTNKIKLFKIVDTLVTDLKEQSVKELRPEKDSLIFIFKRPITNFNLKFKETKNNHIQFLWKKSKNNDSVFVKILNEKIINKDTVYCTVYFDNEYFYNQKQNLEEELKIPLTNQKINSIKRELQDSIIITFTKNITKSYKVNLLNINKESYKYQKLNNKLIIKLKDSAAINTDTINIAYKYLNFEKDTNSITYDTIKAIYKFDRQRITFSRRYSRGNIILAFHKPLLENPKIKLLSMNPLGKWESETINKNRDTVHIKILNQQVMRLNKIRMTVSYYDINHHHDTEWFEDTLDLKTEKTKAEITPKIGQEQQITLLKPVRFKIFNDTTNIRKLRIKAQFDTGAVYTLKIDSAAFIDYFNRTNDTSNIKFNVLSPKDYSRLIIDIKNIYAAIDTVVGDTSNYSLNRGQFILMLLNENNDIVLHTTFKSDKKLKTNFIIPDTYTIKLIYDKNNNNKWDSGDYFKHIQPEKTIFYPKSITLSKGEVKNIIWDFKDNKTEE